MGRPETSKYVITELKVPEAKRKLAEHYATYAKRILWMDDNVVEGAFHMNTAWFMNAVEATTEDQAHTHEADEIIGFFGSDPTDPYDLGGEVEIWLEEDKHAITSSALIFVPAGMKHCPMILKRVDRPIFHFTIVVAGAYELHAKGERSSNGV
jgi:hypothetical protein